MCGVFGRESAWLIRKEWARSMTVIFLIALAALTALNVLLLLTVLTDRFRLWPTPAPGSWQSYVFWPLFRSGLGLTILFGAICIVIAPFGWHGAVGLPLALVGLGFTIYGYFALGLENTYGEDAGLVTSGLYRFSRNPQYVASIAGFAGLAVAAASVPAAILCGLAIVVYVLLPLAEEPWLARVYRGEYERYMQHTPRFLSLATALAAVQTAAALAGATSSRSTSRKRSAS